MKTRSKGEENATWAKVAGNLLADYHRIMSVNME